jgi:uncharacterized membrane protein YbhN (UPF0104 family)
LVAGLAILALVLAYLWGQRGAIEQIDLAAIRWEMVVLLLATRLATRVLNGLMLKWFSAHLEMPLDAVEWFGLTVTASAFNILSPYAGGVVARAAYLKKRHEFPVTRFMSMMGASYVVNLFVSAVITGTLMAINPAPLGTALWPLVIVHAILGTGMLTVMLVPLRWPFGRSNRVFRLIASTLEGWEVLRRSPALILKQIGLTVAQQLLLGVELCWALAALGHGATYWQTMLVTELTTTASLVRLTPGNIGISELLAGLFATVAGASSFSVVSAAVLTRVAGLLIVLPLGPLFSYHLTRRITALPKGEGV